MKRVIYFTPRFIRATEKLKELYELRKALEAKIVEAELEYKHAKYEMEKA